MAAQSTCVKMALVAPRPSDINTASDGYTAFGVTPAMNLHTDPGCSRNKDTDIPIPKVRDGLNVSSQKLMF